jgi:aspartate beta-hydroxylase
VNETIEKLELNESGVRDPVVEFLRSAGAASVKHAHERTLLDHLIGTRDILRRWLLPDWLQNAGALHSVYSTESYRFRLLEEASRSGVQAVVGARAERLAHLFGLLPRRQLLHLADRLDESDSRFESVTRSGNQIELSQADICNLLLLHMANEAEQAYGAQGGPGIWIANVSRLGSKLLPSAVRVPPIFDGCRAVVSTESERRACAAYVSGTGMLGTDPIGARDQLAAASDACPWLGEPLVWRAYVALLQGLSTNACMWSNQAKRCLSSLGVSWDKRLSYDEWILLCTLLHTAASRANASVPAFDFDNPTISLRSLREALADSMEDEVDAPQTKGHDSAAERFHAYFRSLAKGPLKRTSGVYPGLAALPWHEPARFSVVAALEDAFVEIRREIRSLDQHAFHREAERIGRSGSWNVLMFYERGRKNQRTCTHCPITSEIIESHPTVRTLAGLIYVSRLAPGTHIAAHRGPTNMRVRCHLPLLVPDGDCAIRVGEDTRRWEEGRCIVFDDSFDHEAWNHTSSERVVLIVDLWHPDLSPEEIALLEGLHGYAAVQAESLDRYWAANARARGGAYH